MLKILPNLSSLVFNITNMDISKVIYKILIKNQNDDLNPFKQINKLSIDKEASLLAYRSVSISKMNAKICILYKGK